MAKPATLPRGINVFRGRYRVRLTVDGEQHAIGMFDTLGDAKAALDIARSEKARGTFVPPVVKRATRQAEREVERRESVTFGEWAGVWLDAIEANPKRSKSTAVSYRSVMKNHLLPALGAVRLADVTPQLVADHLQVLREKPSARHPGQTGNGIAPNAALVLRSCLNAAVKVKAGGLTAFEFPEAPKHTRVRPEDVDGDVATAEEVRAMAEAMPEHIRVAVPLAAWCAMRLGEVLGLERRDLEHLDDPKRAIVHVRRQWNVKAGALTPPKYDSVRSVAIPASLLPDLVDHLEKHVGPERDAPVLANPTRKSTRVSQTRFDVAWRAARVAAGRPTFRYHDLRHAGLTSYAQQGATLAELLHRGGHSDVTVALRYQHATADRDRALTERLDAMMRRSK